MVDYIYVGFLTFVFTLFVLSKVTRHFKTFSLLTLLPYTTVSVYYYYLFTQAKYHEIVIEGERMELLNTFFNKDFTNPFVLKYDLSNFKAFYIIQLVINTFYFFTRPQFQQPNERENQRFLALAQHCEECKCTSESQCHSYIYKKCVSNYFTSFRGNDVSWSNMIPYFILIHLRVASVFIAAYASIKSGRSMNQQLKDETDQASLLFIFYASWNRLDVWLQFVQFACGIYCLISFVNVMSQIFIGKSELQMIAIQMVVQNIEMGKVTVGISKGGKIEVFQGQLLGNVKSLELEEYQCLEKELAVIQFKRLVYKDRGLKNLLRIFKEYKFSIRGI